MTTKSNFIIALIYLTIICSFIAKASISLNPFKIYFEKPILGFIIWIISVTSLVLMTQKK